MAVFNVDTPSTDPITCRLAVRSARGGWQAGQFVHSPIGRRVLSDAADVMG